MASPGLAPSSTAVPSTQHSPIESTVELLDGHMEDDQTHNTGAQGETVNDLQSEADGGSRMVTRQSSSGHSLIVSPKRKSPRPRHKSPMSDPNFICEHCGKSWTSNYKLKNHMRVHTKEKPFKCRECDARFTQKYDCERHEKAHYGEMRTYDCEVCGRSLASSSSLAKHMTIHTGIKKFKCARCNKAFPTKGDLTKHIRIHTGEKPYTCEVCGRCFAESSSRNRHRMTHTGEKPYKCNLCSEHFLRTNDLKRHVERRHTNSNTNTRIEESESSGTSNRSAGNVVPVYNIEDIRNGKALYDGDILLREVMLNDNEMIYVVVTDENTNTQNNVDHNQSQHTEANETHTDNSNSTGVAVDEKNKELNLNDDKTNSAVVELMNTLDQVEKMQNEMAIDKFISVNKTDNPGQIEIDFEVLPREVHDGSGVTSIHGGVSPASSHDEDCAVPAPKKMIDYIVPQPERTALADKPAKEAGAYVFSTGTSEVAAQVVTAPSDTDGQKSDSSEKKKKPKRKAVSILARETHDCPKCEKRYSTQQALILHSRHHSLPKKERKFECQTCTMKFPTMYKLGAHMRSHSENRPYRCPYCDKAYKARGDLRRHVCVHVEDGQIKQYLCSICGAALASNSSLKKHLNIHAGTRNFPCSLCDKAFYSKGDLDKHFRIHTGDKPYRCSICDRAFAESSTRNSHQRLHSGVKRFECSVCNKRFNRSGDLNRHTRQHTGEKRYSCPNCQSSFTEADALATHKLRYRDSQTGQWQCTKHQTDFGRMEMDLDQRARADNVAPSIPGLYHDGEKLVFHVQEEDLNHSMNMRHKGHHEETHVVYQTENRQRESSLYHKDMAPGIYVRSPEKQHLQPVHVREKETHYPREKFVDMAPALYHEHSEKSETNPYEREKQRIDIHHAGSTSYPYRPNPSMEFAPTLRYSRPNPMDFGSNKDHGIAMIFGSNLDGYPSRGMVPPMAGQGQGVPQSGVEMRQGDNSGGTYRYGFGGTISVVE